MHKKARMEMDYIAPWNQQKRTTYKVITGTVTRITPLQRNGGSDCSQFVSVETKEGGAVNFIVTPETYIADFVTIYRGMQAHFVYNADLPAPLIYPPQFGAAVVVSTATATNVAVGYFDKRLVSADNTLKLNLTDSVPVVTSNNQMFYGSPAGRYLIVMYEASTRSIPAQTTPEKVVVMCQW